MQPLPAYLLKPLLLLLAWPGPLPVVHSHDDFLGRPQSSLLLAGHVALCHGESPAVHDESEESHCHWVLRWVAMDGSFFDAAQFAQDLQMASTVDRHELSLDSTSVAVLCHVMDVDLFSKSCAMESDSTPSLRAPVGLQMHQELCRWVC